MVSHMLEMCNLDYDIYSLLNLLLGMLGFRKWKLGFRCTVSPYVCC